jgi:ubiquinol-cytochrome c reductase cytochrome c subunit
MKLALAHLLALALVATSPALASTGPGPNGIVHSSTGAGLYAANCSSCHGPTGEGLLQRGPSLRRVGARAADFYLRTGYMPLRDPNTQPWRSAVLFSEREIDQLVAYVASLGEGLPIPEPHPARGSLSSGQQLFTQHCAGCHQIVAEGGYVTGARVPALDQVGDRQIAEAVRIGPYVMPEFTEHAISNAQLDSIIRYVDYAKHPDDPGGWSIGHLGPVPEGMVTWLIAAVALVAACMVVGRRLAR